MRKMDIVEQEQDRVQSIVLFGLALFASTEDTETQEKNNIRRKKKKHSDLIINWSSLQTTKINSDCCKLKLTQNPHSGSTVK